MKLLLIFAISQALIRTLTAESVAPSSDEILARLESENNRRRVLLKEYSGSRSSRSEQYGTVLSGSYVVYLNPTLRTRYRPESSRPFRRVLLSESENMSFTCAR